MALAAYVLRHPYTVAAMMLLLGILGVGAGLRMPIDIFPEMDIPVASVVWTYNGMPAPEIQNRILTLHQRQMATLVDNIERIEATSYNGVGVIKVYLHEGADVTRAISQLASSALVVLKYMPPNITPPLIIRFGATDVPIIQLSLSSRTLPDTKLNDLGQNIIRPALAVVEGAAVPYPYGGKPRVIMVDLDQQALTAFGVSASDVSTALQRQNVILPAGNVKMGPTDYTITTNNSVRSIDELNAFPIKETNGKVVYLRDVAHVHDGFQVQTNSVSVNGSPGALMTIRKTGKTSTLAVIDGIRRVLPDIEKIMPPGVVIKPVFDQSIFVKASLNSVLIGGALAAGLTAMMILLFLGNWRLTLIILASIPMSIITAVLFMYVGGQTLNTMTLGGFALAIGILVDNGTVVIENIERHTRMGKPLRYAIVDGAGEVVIPTSLATLCICIVFVPIFLLQGAAKYLFSPLALSVCLSLLASLVLSFTLVPVLFKFLMSGHTAEHNTSDWLSSPTKPKNGFAPFAAIHRAFERSFEALRASYHHTLFFTLTHSRATLLGFFALMAVSLPLYSQLGRDFFPDVDAGQMRLHVRAPPGTKLEATQERVAQIEAAIRSIVGNHQIDTMLDNIGLPYSGVNLALSDSATVGPMDGEILISLKQEHAPTAELTKQLRAKLPRIFAGFQFFFQPADIVDQVLNFGLPAPIDIRVAGQHMQEAFDLAVKLSRAIGHVPGVVNSHVFQVPNAPTVEIKTDRALAGGIGIDQQTVASTLLVTTNSSAQTQPNFWVDPSNNVSYPVVVQRPAYRIQGTQDLGAIPISSSRPDGGSQLLMNLAQIKRGKSAIALSQYNIRPVFDVHASVQGRDLAAVADGIDQVIEANRPDAKSVIKVTLAGQVETMRTSYAGLYGGMALGIVLIYLFLTINFQSWLDPAIVLAAVPFAIGGVMWMLFLTETHLSVPALMGALMCIGLTTANSILVVSFANQRMAAGNSARVAAEVAGYTRLRPVLMTAGAMILGMVPMALGVGEGGEQNAPLARAVIGGLFFATLATLIFVPTLYSIVRRQPAAR